MHCLESITTRRGVRYPACSAPAHSVAWSARDTPVTWRGGPPARSCGGQASTTPTSRDIACSSTSSTTVGTSALLLSALLAPGEVDGGSFAGRKSLIVIILIATGHSWSVQRPSSRTLPSA